MKTTKKTVKEIKVSGFLEPWCGNYRAVRAFGCFVLRDKKGNKVEHDRILVDCTLTFKAPYGYTFEKVEEGVETHSLGKI